MDGNKTFVVNVFTDEVKSNELRYTLEVSHPSYTQPKRIFPGNWDKAQQIVFNQDPEGWTTEEIHNQLRTWGWQIRRIYPVEVKYL